MIIPKAMAYATVAGVAVQVGLYTALLPMAAYALVGSSRLLSVSTTTTIGILTAAAIADVAPDANLAQAAVVAATLAVLVGLMLVAAGLLRLGFVADFISEPVLTGFKAGIGVVILVDQAPKLLGLHLPKGGVARTVTTMLMSLPETHVTTLALAAGHDCGDARALRAGCPARRRRLSPWRWASRRPRISRLERAACRPLG